MNRDQVSDVVGGVLIVLIALWVLFIAGPMYVLWIVGQ